MNKEELEAVHKRLENGEHILINNYGDIDKATFSCWYAEDKKGRYLQIVGQDGATFVSIDHNNINNSYKAMIKSIDFRDNEDIRNYVPHNTELNFLSIDNIELEKDTLNKDERLFKDYSIFFTRLQKSFWNDMPNSKYKKELDLIAKKHPEYITKYQDLLKKIGTTNNRPNYSIDMNNTYN